MNKQKLKYSGHLQGVRQQLPSVGTSARPAGPLQPANLSHQQNDPPHANGRPTDSAPSPGRLPTSPTLASLSHAPSTIAGGSVDAQQASRPTFPASRHMHNVIDLTGNMGAQESRKTASQGSYAQTQASSFPAWQPAVTTATSLPSTQRPRSVEPLGAAQPQTAGPASTPRALRPRHDVPSSPLSTRKPRVDNNVLTSPANFRVRAVKAAWDHNGEDKGQHTRATSYFALASRPYVGLKAKEAILRNNGRLRRLTPTLLQNPEVFHVDFTLDEVRKVQLAVRMALGKPEKETDDPYRDLAKLLRKLRGAEDPFTRLARGICPKIPRRGVDDIRALLDDIMSRRSFAKESRTQQILSLNKDTYDKRGEELRESRLSSLLMAREVSGGRGSMRTLQNFPNEFRKHFEESLEMRTEFTNCAGDVSTISWVSNNAYLAGTTVHMDSHNQQYNKPSNLVLGSVSRRSATLQAYSDHRIPRPVVDRGQNSTEAMRESQDPWLYTSVVCSDYDPIHDRTYTSGFDKKVKVWKVDKSGSTMECIQTWEHQGAVNFVQASSLEDDNIGLVATAADVPVDAVRVYRVPKDDRQIGQSSFLSFSCSRILNLDGTPLITDKWTYFPSTMKWGIAAGVRHMLLVGYSPRSLTNDDNDIPIDRGNTGELCLWDALSGNRVHITAAKTQNVFEVLWHPSQPVFIAATSPTGEGLKDSSVKTQVRIFKLVENNGYFGGPAFSQIKALDCAADDINELTIMPNSVAFSYVTAGCTDGKAYVWDTALSDKPIQVLAHDSAFEGVTAGDDEDDTGVKFTAWGKSLDRFYTGSSDGIVKVWNVRCSEKKAKGTVILEAAAQISFGAFSPDRSKLVIGDASGRVFVLSVDKEDGKPPQFDPFLKRLGIQKRKPNEVTPHAPPPPPGSVLLSNQQLGHSFVAARQLQYSGDPTVGMVQDTNYAETGLFDKEAHADHDPSGEVLGHVSSRLQENLKMHANSKVPARTRRLRNLVYTQDKAVEPDDARRTLLKKHADNCELDLEFEDLSLELRDVLTRDGIGQRELTEGPEYLCFEEDDEAELRMGRVEVVRGEDEHETRLWL